MTDDQTEALRSALDRTVKEAMARKPEESTS